MKTHFFMSTALTLSLGLSLSLTACAPQSLQSPATPDLFQNPLQSPHQGQHQEVFFTYRAPSDSVNTFQTQAVDTAELAFIKLTLVGEGLSGAIENVGGFIPVTQGKAAASIRNVPIQPGNVRIVTVQGYDADQQPLPAFVGKGIYTSRAGQVTININIDRRQLLVGLALEKLLATQQGGLPDFDLEALLAATDTATGFDGVNFATDPLLFNVDRLSEQLLNNETVALGLGLVNNSVGLTSVSVSTLGGGRFTEALSLTFNDPLSSSAPIALNASSPQTLNFSIAPGTWKAQLKKADGTVLATADVTVTADGKAILSQEAFTLSLKPEITQITPGTVLNTGGGKVTLKGSGFSGVTEVRLGTTPVSFTAISDTEIELNAPESLGNAGITVVTPGGTSASQTLSVVDKPQVSTVSVSSGAEGDEVVITGLAFDPVPAKNAVYFGSTLATLVPDKSEAGKLTVVVPALTAGSHPISVQTSQRTSTSQAFAVKPSLAKLTTQTGFLVKGLGVNLDAKGLDTTQAANNTVNFVNTSVNPPQTVSVAGLAFSNNALVAQVPVSLSAGTYTISVTVNNQTSNTLTLQLPQVGVNLSGGLF